MRASGVWVDTGGRSTIRYHLLIELLVGLAF